MNSLRATYESTKLEAPGVFLCAVDLDLFDLMDDNRHPSRPVARGRAEVDFLKVFRQVTQ